MKRIYILLFIVYLWTNPAFAAWYQVEVIVFDNLYPDSDGELWYKIPGLPDRDGSQELLFGNPGAENIDSETKDDNSGALIPYKLLPKDKYRMGGIYRVLRLSEKYRPLIHTSWQQPGVARARPVHIEKLDGAIPETELSDVNEPDFLIPPKAIVDGIIRVRGGHFLHVDVDLAYFLDSISIPGLSPHRDTVANDMLVNQNAEYVRLNETRKIRLNELHYFDHPMFGLILQVSRLRRE